MVVPLIPPADAAIHPAAAVTTPQRPSVVTTMHPPLPTTMTMTPATPATPPCPAEEVFFQVGEILPGWKQVFILEHLATILGNKNFFKHVAKTNEVIKEGIRMLKQMCVERKLPRTGSKTLLIKRLVGCHFTNLDEFEVDFEGTCQEFETQWQKAKMRTRDEELSALAVLAAAATVAPPPCVSGFRLSFLALVWRVKRLGVFPKDDAETPIFEFCGLQHDATCVLDELNSIDTTPFESRDGALANSTEKSNQVPVQRRTPTCALRLFQIILGNNHFHGRLLADSADTPNREELDAGAYGQNADFWVEVHAAYIDPAFTIGNILVDGPMFQDNNGHLFDLSQVHSPWVDHSKLKLWYETTLRALQKFRVNHDKSGQHAFDTEEGYQEFAHNYAADSKDVCFLAGAARYRGDEALDFFSGELPDDVPIVEGLSRRRLHSSEETLASDVTGITTRPPRVMHDGVLNENDQAILAALAKGNSPSKERDSYYHQRTKKLKIENKNGKEREGLKLASQRAQSSADIAQSITQMYAAAKQASENGASEKVVRKIRARAERLVSSMGRATTARSSDTGSDVNTSSSSSSSSDDEEDK